MPVNATKMVRIASFMVTGKVEGVRLLIGK